MTQFIMWFMFEPSSSLQIFPETNNFHCQYFKPYQNRRSAHDLLALNFAAAYREYKALQETDEQAAEKKHIFLYVLDINKDYVPELDKQIESEHQRANYCAPLDDSSTDCVIHLPSDQYQILSIYQLKPSDLKSGLRTYGNVQTNLDIHLVKKSFAKVLSCDNEHLQYHPSFLQCHDLAWPALTDKTEGLCLHPMEQKVRDYYNLMVELLVDGQTHEQTLTFKNLRHLKVKFADAYARCIKLLEDIAQEVDMLKLSNLGLLVNLEDIIGNSQNSTTIMDTNRTFLQWVAGLEAARQERLYKSDEKVGSKQPATQLNMMFKPKSIMPIPVTKTTKNPEVIYKPHKTFSCGI